MEILHVETTEQMEKVEVFSGEGKLLFVYFPNAAKIELSTTTYPSGNYFLKIQCENDSFLRKISVVN